ncbi:MAG TPA: MoaD/ThiS family protein [Longilinea sp.]|nr:MoaD/ThiS family protein [Longilinea sp.]
MPVTVIYRNKEMQVKANCTVLQMLKELGFSPESHLVVRQGVLLNERDRLKEGDQVKLVPAISGGS